MAKWIEEFRRGWQGISEPPAVLGFGLAAVCLMLATVFRFGISHLHADVPYSAYLPPYSPQPRSAESEPELPPQLAARLSACCWISARRRGSWLR